MKPTWQTDDGSIQLFHGDIAIKRIEAELNRFPLFEEKTKTHNPK